MDRIQKYHACQLWISDQTSYMVLLVFPEGINVYTFYIYTFFCFKIWIFRFMKILCQ